MGTFSSQDIAKYCAAKSQPGANPRPFFDVSLNQGVSISITRSAEFSFCMPNIETGTSSRNLDYSTVVTVGNEAQTFNTVIEVLFGNRAACSSWSEYPWSSND